MGRCRVVLMVLLVWGAGMVAGCTASSHGTESVVDKTLNAIDRTDQWIRENLW